MVRDIGCCGLPLWYNKDKRYSPTEFYVRLFSTLFWEWERQLAARRGMFLGSEFMNSENDSQKVLRGFIVIAAAVLGLVLVVLFATGKLDDFLVPDGDNSVSDVQSIDGSSVSSSSGGSSGSSDVNGGENSAESSSGGSSESSDVSSVESSADNSVDSSANSANSSEAPVNSSDNTTGLRFRNSKLLEQHYQKHGIDMGFASAEEYEKAAAAVPRNPDALHKTEAEDGDDVYYIESTNEFVIVSTDGFLRTYFNPDRGIDYFNRQ